MGAHHLLAADLPAASRALATAFADDPMLTWMSGDAVSDDRIGRSADAFFTPSLAAGLRRGHSYGLGGDGFDAVAVWSPPDVAMFDEEEVGALASAVVGTYGEEALGRLMALGDLVSSHHPDDRPHFYLFLLGAATQGQGAGARVLDPVLARCDIDGVGVYLESSSSRNVGFYERLGFTVQWEETPDPGGPLIRGMWRDPAPGA